MATTGKIAEDEIRDYVNSEMRVLLAPAFVGTGGLSRKNAYVRPEPKPVDDDPTRAFDDARLAKGFLKPAAPAPPKPAPQPVKLKGGFFRSAKAKAGGLLESDDDRGRGRAPPAEVPRGFCAPREADKDNENAVEFAAKVDAMRRAGVSEEALSARLKDNFEMHASPLQRKAAEYGVKLAKEGHGEDYIREKMAAYMRMVERFDADDE